MYAIVEDGVVTKYPVDLGVDFSETSFPSPLREEDLPASVVQVYASAPPYVPYDKNLLETTPIYDEGQSRWIQNWSLVDCSPEDIPARIKTVLKKFSDKRDEMLAKGIPWDGHLWHGDQMSQNTMATVLVLGQTYESATGQAWSTRWKCLDGRVTVTVQSLAMAGLQVGAAVEAAFAREEELANMVNNGQVEEALAQINTGWPGQS